MKKTRIIALVMFILMFIAPLSAYAADNSKGSVPAGFVEITDMVGRKVTLKNNIEKAVTIHGACMMPGILAALGCGDKLISGICFSYGADDFQFKIQPSYSKLGVISPNQGEVNVEELIALAPDVVFVWNNVQNVDKLEDSGVPVVVTDISSWENTVKMFKLVGKIMKKEAEAERITRYMQSMSDRIGEKIKDIPESKRKRVLFVTNTKPLTVMGNVSHNSFMIERAGGVSVAQELQGHFVDVSMESILEINPDIILATAASNRVVGDQIKADDTWQTLAAVKNDHVYTAPWGVFLWDKPSAEIALFLLWEAHLFYPELFSEQELKDETVSYYKTFFNYNLSDEEVNRIIDDKSK